MQSDCPFANLFCRERGSVVRLVAVRDSIGGDFGTLPTVCGGAGEDFGRAWFGPIRFGPRERATASKAGGQAGVAGERTKWWKTDGHAGCMPLENTNG